MDAELEAAIKAYNEVWEAATNLTAHTVAKVRETAMRAALEAAKSVREQNDAL